MENRFCRVCGKITKPQAGRRVARLVCSPCSVTKRRRKVKALGIEYLGGKCKICGYDKCVAALTFHHRDPSKKEFGLSVRGITRAWEKVKEELNKCDLLCANCHMEFHWNVSQQVVRSAVNT